MLVTIIIHSADILSCIPLIAPGDDYSVPIEAVRSSSIQVRPDREFLHL